MASSVSSERAFSSAGITISKRRNRLKGDIVEALQFLKCLYVTKLIFRQVTTAEGEQKLMEEEPLLDTDMDADLESGFSWDEFIEDGEDANDGDDEDDGDGNIIDLDT